MIYIFSFVFSDDHVKFFLFQVLEHQIKYRYERPRNSPTMSFCNRCFVMMSKPLSLSLSQTQCPERPSAAAHQRDTDEMAAGTGSCIWILLWSGYEGGLEHLGFRVFHPKTKGFGIQTPTSTGDLSSRQRSHPGLITVDM